MYGNVAHMKSDYKLYKKVMNAIEEYWEVEQEGDAYFEIQMTILFDIERNLKYYGIPKCKDSVKGDYTPTELIYWYLNKMEVLFNEG